MASTAPKSPMYCASGWRAGILRWAGAPSPRLEAPGPMFVVRILLASTQYLSLRSCSHCFMSYTYLHMCIYLYVSSRLPCICKLPFSLENCGSHDCGAKACLHFITFSNVLFVSSVLLGVLSTHDHGFHGFWGYIAYFRCARMRDAVWSCCFVARSCANFREILE